MQSESIDVRWLDRFQQVSIDDLVALSGLGEADIHELVELGALAPLDHGRIPWSFRADCVVTVRKACRLRDDLELDAHALALAMTLLEQIQTLEAELSGLRARQPVFRKV